MNDILFDIGYGHFLVLAAVLFVIGVGRRAHAPQRAHHPDERRAACSTPRNLTLLAFARMRATTRTAHAFALHRHRASPPPRPRSASRSSSRVFRGRRNVNVDELTTLKH